MWFPNLLPRAKTVTFFHNGAGQAQPAVGGSQRPREVAPPPCDMSHNLIIHLDLVEDRSPPRVRTPSSSQSGAPSSVSSESDELPRIYNFDDWTPGVLDGLQACPSAAACRPPPRAGHHDNDSDNDDDGSHRRLTRGFLERGKQAFGLLRRAGASSGNADCGRSRTRSPPHSRHQGTAGEVDEPVDGGKGKGVVGDVDDSADDVSADGGRGRRLARDGPASPRQREPMRRVDSDWERRRSLSPQRRTGHGQVDKMTAAEKSADRGDLGLALLSGMLQAADGAPPPLAMHPDPMMDFYGSLCADFIPEMAVGSTNHWDPMLEEMETWCDREIAVTRSLSFSPLPPRSDEMVRSPEYTPQSALWDRVADLNTEAAALGINNVIHFGPRVQLTKEVGGKIVTAGITEQVAQMMLDERRNTIVDSMFVPCEQPMLPDPAPPAARGGGERESGREGNSWHQTQHKTDEASLLSPSLQKGCTPAHQSL